MLAAAAILVLVVAGSWFAFRETADTRLAAPPTAQTAIDASPLDAGEYQLTLRREGGEWQMFPLRLR